MISDTRIYLIGCALQGLLAESVQGNHVAAVLALTDKDDPDRSDRVARAYADAAIRLADAVCERLSAEARQIRDIQLKHMAEIRDLQAQHDPQWAPPGGLGYARGDLA